LDGLARPPDFVGADAVAVLRAPRTHGRRMASISGAKPTSTRRFEAETEVASASTHPGSPPMIRRIKKKTNSQPWRQSRGWRQMHGDEAGDGDK
jgi:hypothetical protein